jgi:hypothetical protein
MSSSFSIACSYQPPLPADQVKPLVEFEYDAGNSCIQMEGKPMCTERITTKFLGCAEAFSSVGCSYLCELLTMSLLFVSDVISECSPRGARGRGRGRGRARNKGGAMYSLILGHRICLSL